MSRTVRIAIFGNGFARLVILPCLRQVKGSVVVGISSPNQERARATAAEFGIPSVSTDHREILRSTRPDLVFVATPPHRHAEMAVEALEAGCHVVCEKPMALTSQESARMLEAARRHPTQLALIDHELRFLPARRAARKLVEEGALGRMLRADYLLHTPGRADPLLPWNWWSDASRGGGLLGALGSHAVDALQLLMGPIHQARGTLHTFLATRPDRDTGRPREVTSDDLAVATLRFASGAVGTISLSAVEAERVHQLTVTGSEGSLRLTEQQPLRVIRRGTASSPASSVSPASPASPASFWQEHPAEEDLPTSTELGIPDTDWARAFLRLARAVVSALGQSGPELPEAAGFAEGHATQRVLDAIRRADREQGWVEVRNEPPMT